MERDGYESTGASKVPVKENGAKTGVATPFVWAVSIGPSGGLDSLLAPLSSGWEEIARRTCLPLSDRPLLELVPLLNVLEDPWSALRP